MFGEALSRFYQVSYKDVFMICIDEWNFRLALYRLCTGFMRVFVVALHRCDIGIYMLYMAFVHCM